MNTAPKARADAEVRVGVLGYGNVGAALVHRLLNDADELLVRTGMRFTVSQVAVRSLERPGAQAERFLTTDADALVRSDDVDVVIEVMGSIEPARSLILAALAAGKPVVTANKELLAAAGPELYEAASNAGVDLLFEAAVAGGIPLIRPLRESLAGERISRVLGIVNGTTNFILTRMAEDQADFDTALKEAQRLGFAEADPTADVMGDDAAAKTAILAGIAFGAQAVVTDVMTEGIVGVTPAAVAAADAMDHVIKLLAIVERVGFDEVSMRVQPTLVPKRHPLASVRDSFNAVFIEGDQVGELMLYGRGAGGGPTASAVLGDLIDAAHNLRSGGRGRTPSLSKLKAAPIDDLYSRFWLELHVIDQPGVLAAVADVFGKNDVSIRSMEQQGLGGSARLLFVTHAAREASMRRTLVDLSALKVVRSVGMLLRVLDMTS